MRPSAIRLMNRIIHRVTDRGRKADAAPGPAVALSRCTDSFGVTKKKSMVGRTVDLVIEAVAQPA